MCRKPVSSLAHRNRIWGLTVKQKIGVKILCCKNFSTKNAPVLGRCGAENGGCHGRWATIQTARWPLPLRTVLRSFIHFQVEVKVPWWRVRLFYEVESHFLTGKNLKRLFWCGFWSVPQSLWTGGQARQGAESWSGLRLYNRCDLLQFEVLFREQEEYATDAICCSLRFYSENKKNM